MKITIKKFKNEGFIGFPRSLIQNLKDKRIKIESMALLMVMVGLADWDERHDNFGKLIINNTQLGLIANLNRNTVRKIKKELVSGSYIQILEKEDGCDVIGIANFENYQKRKTEKTIDAVSVNCNEKEAEVTLEDIEDMMKDTDL